MMAYTAKIFRNISNPNFKSASIFDRNKNKIIFIIKIFKLYINQKNVLITTNITFKIINLLREYACKMLCPNYLIA